MLLTPIFGIHICFLHSYIVLGFPGSENVQAVQKYITGLDARRLSKFPEFRYLYYL